jgi:hypothetical protein
MPEGAELNYIRSRVNLPTEKSSAEIARDIPAQIRARAFFSARVADAHILDRFRTITDDYMLGKIGRDEARNLMLEYARERGMDDGTRGMSNLASTARLNLMIDQNAAMAKAVGDYERMYSPTHLKLFPYVIYHASVGSKVPRSEHQQYDGMIFDKNDPWLVSHTPPWEFGCHCQLEECSEKKAGKTPELIQPLSPPEVANKVYSKSGFRFDPRHGFEEFDMSSIKDPAYRRETYRQMAFLAKRTDAETTFLAAPAKPVPVCAAPENMGEIKAALGEVKKAIDERKEGEGYEFPELQVSLGYIAKERFDAIGMQPDDNLEVIFESPGKSDYGMKHWENHHLNDWKKPEAVKKFIQMLSATLWNPEAKMENTLSKIGKRIDITSPDGRYVTSLWRKGHFWVYSIQSVWDMSGSLRGAPLDVRSQRQRKK